MKFPLLLVALLTASFLVAQTQETEAPMTIGDYENIDSIETQLSGIDTKVTTVEEKLALIELEVADMKMSTPLLSPAQLVDDLNEDFLPQGEDIRVSVLGQGVAPTNTSSPAQAYALAKRAATADAYRLVAEKVMGVRIEGQDVIKNMMVKRSTVRTSVKAMVRNANVVETTFKEGLCEVEMEIHISHAQFAQ